MTFLGILPVTAFRGFPPAMLVTHMVGLKMQKYPSTEELDAGGS